MKRDLFYIGPLAVHGYGLMIAVGFLLCVLLGRRRARQKGENADAILDIALLGIFAGFLGAKLLYLIVELPSFLENPQNALSAEGFVVYGGVIAGVLSGLLYCRRKGLKFLAYFDIAAPCIALAQGFGRIGCFLAGCCYGRETALPVGVVFPEGSLAPAGVRLLPTQLFSSAGDFLIVALLMLHERWDKSHGETGARYMALYGGGRFFMEFLRADRRGGVGALSTSQFISVIIVVGGVLLLAWVRKRASRRMED